MTLPALSIPDAVTLLTALGCAVMASLYFAFSTSVVRALADRAPIEGLETMEAINRRILNPVFLSAFFATAAACVAIAVASVTGESGTSRISPLTGAPVYLLASFGVTVARNVSLNNELESTDGAAPGSAEVWRRYLRKWTFWNHLRCVASLVAAGLLLR